MQEKINKLKEIVEKIELLKISMIVLGCLTSDEKLKLIELEKEMFDIIKSL